MFSKFLISFRSRALYRANAEDLLEPIEYRNWRRNLVIIWISQFLSLTSFNSAITFIPFYFTQIGVPDSKLSWYVAMFAASGNLSFCIFAPIWGMTADIYGRKMMLLRANYGAGVLFILMSLITNPNLLVAHRFLLGALTGTVTAAQTLVISTTPPQHRSFALGAISSALFGGIMAGQFAGGDFVMHAGFKAAFIVSGICLLSSGFLVHMLVKESFNRTETLRQHLSKVSFRLPQFGLVWYLMLLFICLGLAQQFDTPFLPLLVKDVMHNAPEALSWTGRISGICAPAGIVAGVILGHLADRMSLVKLVIIAIIITGITRMLQAASTGILVLLIERIFMILGIGGLEPLLQSWLAGVTDEHDHGSYFGWAACAKAVGWIFGAMAGGAISILLGGVRGVFVGAGILFLLLIPIVIHTSRLIPPPRVFRKSVGKG